MKMTLETTGSKNRRRFAWLAAAIVAVIILYTGGWYYVAGQVDTQVSNAIASANGDGVRLNCENSQVNGYPFRLGVNCDSILFEQTSEGLSVSAGAFRTAAQVYNPSFLIWEIDGPAHIEAGGLLPLQLNWELLRSSVRLSVPLPTRVSIESRLLKAAIDAGNRQQQLLAVEAVEAHMRPNDAALDLAASIGQLLIDESLLEGEALPPLDAGLDFALDDGVRWAANGAQSLRGQSGTLRRFFLSLKGGSLDAKGTFSVDAGEGLLDAKLTFSIRNADALSQSLIKTFPSAASQIANFTASLKALGEDAELPLRVVKGKIIYGFIELGEIPPLP